MYDALPTAFRGVPAAVLRTLSLHLVALLWQLERWGTPEATGPAAIEREQRARAAIEALSADERARLRGIVNWLAGSLARASKG